MPLTRGERVFLPFSVTPSFYSPRTRVIPFYCIGYLTPRDRFTDHTIETSRLPPLPGHRNRLTGIYCDLEARTILARFVKIADKEPI